MTNIAIRDNYRVSLLKEFYKKTKGDISQTIDLKILGKNINIPDSEIRKAYHFLIEEALITARGTGYYCCLSHVGIKYIESLSRKVNLSEPKPFSETELFQLKIMLSEINEQILLNKIGQEVIFDRIEEAFEESKVKTKPEWKDYFQIKVQDWITNKSLDFNALAFFDNILKQ